MQYMYAVCHSTWVIFHTYRILLEMSREYNSSVFIYTEKYLIFSTITKILSVYYVGIIDGGTWEHRKRAKEMLETAAKNLSQTVMGNGNHFMGDFLPVCYE
jgi:hypothetical protein